MTPRRPNATSRNAGLNINPLTFSADGFLHHMVRILTGTLLEVGLGKRPAESMPALLAEKRRAAAGQTAPAAGLCLMEVRYP